MVDYLTFFDDREDARSTPAPLYSLSSRPVYVVHRPLPVFISVEHVSDYRDHPSTTFDANSTEALPSHDLNPIDIPTQYIINQDDPNSVAEWSDNVFASLDIGSVGIRGYGTALSSSPRYDSCHNLPRNNDPSVEDVHSGEWNFSPGFTHDGLAINTQKETGYDDHDRLLDPMLGGMPLSSMPQKPESFCLSTQPTLTWPNTTGFDSNILHGNKTNNEHHHVVAAMQPGLTGLYHPSVRNFSNYTPVPRPLNSTSVSQDSSLSRSTDSWDLVQTTCLHETTTQHKHGDKIVPKSRKRKLNPKLTQLSGVDVFVCPVCTYFSGDIGSLIEHLRCHVRTHACAVVGCERRFHTSRDLTRHKKSAHSNTGLNCPICLKVIKGSRVDNLQRHVRTLHSAQDMEQSSLSDSSSWSNPIDCTWT